MSSTHYTDSLAAFLDNQLNATQRRQVEDHLAMCDACRAECETVRAGIAMMSALPRVSAPDSLWIAIAPAARRPSRMRSFYWPVAAALLLGASFVLYWALQPKLAYETLRADGTPTGVRNSAHSIQTDADSRARLTISSIGTVELAPSTSVRVLAAKPNEQRISLQSGILHASIQAPPRIFFVETSAGTAIDLGCEYSLQCDRQGSGILRVTRGWVSYQSQGKESLVPAGALCWTRPGHGPGTPVFDDAPPPFLDALKRWDFEAGGDPALRELLASARLRDTLTLWHLLSRSNAEQRSLIYDRMAALSPPPAGVTRADVLRLHQPALDLWKAELAWQW